MVSRVALCICFENFAGEKIELTISTDMEVLCRCGKGRPAPLDKTRRDIDDFIWEVEAFAENWQKTYGQGDITDPGGWMILLEQDRAYTKYQGFSQYPEDWGEFMELLDRFLSG